MLYCPQCSAEANPTPNGGYHCTAYSTHNSYPKSLDTFTSAYVECALWSSIDDDGEPLDNDYTDSDLSPECLSKMVEDCKAFQKDNAADLDGIDPSQCGHDFWLTRNRHGAGFWDRGLGDVGQRLTDAAHVYGSADLYVGDDGYIHHS